MTRIRPPPARTKLETRADNEVPLWLQKYEQWVLRLSDWLSNHIFIPLFLNVSSYPYRCIIGVTFISVLLPLVAFFTDSIRVETDHKLLILSPDSYPRVQDEWIEKNFEVGAQSLVLLHAGGENVLTVESILTSFDVVETISTLKDYDKWCGQIVKHCELQSVTQFWKNREQFETELELAMPFGNEYVREKISAPTFADGHPVISSNIFGQLTDGGEENSTSAFAKSLMISITLPKLQSNEDEAFTTDFYTQLLNLAQVKEKSSSKVTLRIYNSQMLTKDLDEPVQQDMPLFGVTFGTMSLFTAICFCRWKKNAKGQRFVTSNFALGLGATITVAMSLLTGFSFCMICGFAITSSSQVLPFVLLGIGIDDAFVIVAQFRHSDPNLTLDDRLKETAKIACPSITVTSLTDCVAFSLAAFSDIPDVKYFAFFAAVTVMVDFIYQITFFMALLVLDHRRIENNRYDCCLCCIKADVKLHDDSKNCVEMPRKAMEKKESSSITNFYAKFLLNPFVKVLILVTFFTMFFVGLYYASLVEVEFDRTALTRKNAPSDLFEEDRRKYYSGEKELFFGELYYQGVDFSDPTTRASMINFRKDILALGRQDEKYDCPGFLADFEQFLAKDQSTEIAMSNDFSDQLTLFFNYSENQLLYGDNINLDDEAATILSLKEPIILARDTSTIKDQVEFLKLQREITLRQPLNHQKAGNNDRQFLYSSEFILLEHFRIMPRELIFTLALNMIAVWAVCTLFTQHPSGPILALLVIIMVDVDLVAFMVVVGYHLNTLTFIILVMSIGLVADYVLHVLHSYFHVHAFTRTDRIVLALEQIGGSVLLGGLTTLLGVSALAFSSGQALFTFFVVFGAMVGLGLLHGLVFLPVVLSLLGPQVADTLTVASSQNSLQSESEKSMPSVQHKTTYMGFLLQSEELQQERKLNHFSRFCGPLDDDEEECSA